MGVASAYGTSYVVIGGVGKDYYYGTYWGWRWAAWAETWGGPPSGYEPEAWVWSKGDWEGGE